MSWTVTLSYHLRTPLKRGNRGQFHAHVHHFDTHRDAEAFANRAQIGLGWVPAGAYDHDVSEPIETFDTKRAAS